MNIKNMHPASKGLLIATAGALVYLFSATVYYLLSPPRAPTMMGHMMGRAAANDPFYYMLSYTIPLIIALASMLAISVYFFSFDKKDEKIKILKKALSKDENEALEKIREAGGGITQDSLRFRLGWSKAKISTIINNLDRRGIIQRERFGKTYKIYCQEDDEN